MSSRAMGRKDKSLQEARRLALAGRVDEADRLCRQALRRQPRNVAVMSAVAEVERLAGRFAQALTLLERARTIAPDDPAIALETAAVHAAAGRLSESRHWYGRAIELNPEDPGAHLGLARTLMQLNRPGEAAAVLERALELVREPDSLHRWLADAYFQQGRVARAIPHYERAVALAPTEAQPLLNLAMAYDVVGRHEEALARLDEAVRLRPGMPTIAAAKAELLYTMGRRDEARALVRESMARGADDASLAVALGRMAQTSQERQEAIVALRRAANRGDVEPHNRALVWYRLGALLEEENRFDEAFDAYRRANDQERTRFDADAHRARVDRIIAFFDASRLDALPRAEVHSDRPVFIVGMPRSGTSLIEQILDAHPEAAGAGEIDGIARVIQGLSERTGGASYPENIALIDRAALTSLARGYLARLDEVSVEARRVTDKVPHNFEHLGLISRLLGGARVIHCRRHPLSTCLSCYATSLNRTHVYTHRLEDLAAAYRDYARLMEHWQSTLALPILDVDYERLVADPEAQARRIVEFCGLAWDPACLEFHRGRRIATTASVDQVRRPIYDSSAARHARFAAHLRPLADALRDLLPD